MKTKITLLLLALSFPLSSAYSQIGGGPNYVLVGKADHSGTEYFVDTASIRDFGTERIATIKEKKPDVWYNKIERDIIDGYDAVLLVEGFGCSDGTFAIYESSKIDKDGQLIKTEYKLPIGDSRVPRQPIKAGAVGESLAKYVCNARITGDMSGDSPTNGSKIIRWPADTDDIASLGPDAEGKYSVYLYKKSLHKQGRYLAYVIKMEYATPFMNNGGPIKTIVQETVFDCSTKKFQGIKTEAFSPSGQLLGEQKIDPEFAPWSPAPKGSFADRIGSVYCSK